MSFLINSLEKCVLGICKGCEGSGVLTENLHAVRFRGGIRARAR